MAVTVLRDPTLILDRQYTVVEVDRAARAEFGPLEGRNLWDCFPGSEPLFAPYYESAWSTNEPVEFLQFYDGRVNRIRATARDDRLVLSWEVVAQLDLLTLEGLRSSIDEAIAALDLSERSERSARGQHARPTLRLVRGAA